MSNTLILNTTIPDISGINFSFSPKGENWLLMNYHEMHIGKGDSLIKTVRTAGYLKGKPEILNTTSIHLHTHPLKIRDLNQENKFEDRIDFELLSAPHEFRKSDYQLENFINFKNYSLASYLYKPIESFSSENDDKSIPEQVLILYGYDSKTAHFLGSKNIIEKYSALVASDKLLIGAYQSYDFYNEEKLQIAAELPTNYRSKVVQLLHHDHLNKVFGIRASGELEIIDLETLKIEERKILEEHKIISASLNEEKNILLTLTDRGNVKIWKFNETNKFKKVLEHQFKDRVKSASLSAKGNLIYISMFNETRIYSFKLNE